MTLWFSSWCQKHGSELTGVVAPLFLKNIFVFKKYFLKIDMIHTKRVLL